MKRLLNLSSKVYWLLASLFVLFDTLAQIQHKQAAKFGQVAALRGQQKHHDKSEL